MSTKQTSASKAKIRMKHTAVVVGEEAFNVMVASDYKGGGFLSGSFGAPNRV
jgi:hypothetical protein